MNEQNFTSAATSINQTKLPAIFNKQPLADAVRKWTTAAVLDYGCGRYTAHIEKHVRWLGAEYLPFDPFNQDQDTNENSRNMAALYRLCGSSVVVTCSNVLNVIDSDAAVINVIRDCCELGNAACFTVYEGDRTGNGRQTGPDQYQRNMKLRSYLPLFEAAGVAAGIQAGMIVAHR